jgi:tartrate-resistant acid phosphatase type 5
MKNKILALVAALLLFPLPPNQAKSPPEIVRFIAFGDAGAASGAQYAVAEAMAAVCAARGCDFAVMLGDNFYPAGVRSVHDPQFETKFEEPYAALDMPFFAALGNHDNGEPAAHMAYGDFQVAYSQRTDRPSDRWRMPARYYKFSAPLTGVDRASDPPYVDLFGLDSTPLTPYAEDPDPKWQPATYGTAQLRWLQRALAGSTAPWKIVFAHHPYEDGPVWRQFLQQSVCAAGVDLMLQGHDHLLRWLKPVPGCGKTEFVTSGAGGAQLTFVEDEAPAYWQVSRYGFFWFEASRDRLSGAAFALSKSAELVRDKRGRPKPAFERTLRKP